MKCLNCGKELAENAKFCTKCGTPTAQEPISNEIPHNTDRNKDPREPFVWKEQYTYVAIAVVIILAAIIGFVIKTNKLANSQVTSDAVIEDITTEIEDYGNEYRQDNAYQQYNEGFENDEYVQESNIEEQVLAIREEYNNIVESVNSGIYDEKILSNGVSAYYEKNIIRNIIVPKNAIENQYMQSYYYDSSGNIIFAYYESNDANRLYFENFKLIRWRYSSSAGDAQNAVNHDLENSNEYLYWEDTVLYDSYYYVQMTIEDEETFENEYILPGSDTQYLDRQNLKGLTAEECRLARNELYARHGRMFDDEELQSYFETKKWYNGTIAPSDFKEEILNDYEVYNRDLIVEYEKEMGYR